jgi:hypothetical protein
MIARSVRREPIGFAFTEDVGVIMVFRRYMFIENRVQRYVREVNGVGVSGFGDIGCPKHKGLRSF